MTLGCSSGALDEVWYHYNVQGSVQTGEFVAADPDGTKSTCPDTGIKYLPKSGSSTGGGTSSTSSGSNTATSTGSTTTSGSSQPTGGSGTSFSGKGFLEVTSGGTQTGCIISSGAWYTGGTCAIFTAAANGEFFPSSII